jgi:hypothetical protein
MGLLALASPLFAEPAISGFSAGQSATASERRLLRMSMASAMATDSSRFLHPLVTLLGFVTARSAAAHVVAARPTALLSFDALRHTSLAGSLWMVRNRRFVQQRIPSGLDAPYSSLLRC